MVDGLNFSTPSPENCLKPFPFTCIKDIDKDGVKIRISPAMIPAYASSSDCPNNPDLLTCKIEVNGRKVSSKDDRWMYQWYKDGIPIAGKAYVFRISYFSEPMKKDSSVTHIASRQGSYYCEARLAGTSKTLLSPSVDLFYSDFSTYVVDISFHDANRELEYSRYNFKEVMRDFERAILAPLLQVAQSKYPTVVWDFQSARNKGNSSSAKILFYIYQDNPDLLKSEITFGELKKLMEAETNEIVSINASVSVSSADVCFSQEAKEDSCGGSTSWPTSKQSSFVSTDPMCLDGGKRLITRQCQGSNSHKAEWSEFNCSVCHSFQPTVPDLEFLCPAGYTKLPNSHFCFKIYYTKMAWDEAFDVCSRNSGYLLSEMLDGFDPSVSFWLSYQYSYGKIQNKGFKRMPSNLMTISSGVDLNHNSLCVGAVFNGKHYALKVLNCSKNLAFVCIQKPYEPVSSVKFSYTWTKLRGQETCYNFEKESLYTWHRSKERCQQMIPKAILLKGIQSLENYRYMKMLMYQLFNASKCSSFSWWMNLKYGDYHNFKEVQHSFGEYVDWNPYTNFEFDEGYGALTLFPGKKIQWSLAQSSTKQSFICEIPLCNDDRPTEAYIEDRSFPMQDNVIENKFTALDNFLLRCIPSGWFVTNTVRWYKDNILLDETSDQFNFSNYVRTEMLSPGLELQGYYSCSVDQVYPRKAVFSSQVLFRLPSFHTYVMHIESENVGSFYAQDCSSFMLSEILNAPPPGNLLMSLRECFKSFFIADGLISDFYLYLKNLTCDNNAVHMTVHLYINKTQVSEEQVIKQIRTMDLAHFADSCIAGSSSVSVKSTVQCYGERSQLKNRNLTWPTTALRKTAVPLELCLTDKGVLVQRKCIGDFNTGATWSRLSLTECCDAKSDVTEKLHSLLLLDKLDASHTSDALAKLTSSKSMLPADVQITSEILSSLSKKDHFDSEVMGSVVKTVSNIIDLPQKVLEEATNVSNEILDSFEHIISTVCIGNSPVEASAPNVALGIYPLESSVELNVPNCAILMEWAQNLKTFYNVSVYDLNVSMHKSEAGIVLPANLVAEKMLNSSDRVTYVIHQNFNFVKNVSIVSAVIQASFQGLPVFDVQPPVEMFFKLNKEAQTANHSTLKCVYWDQRLNENYGGWSYKGCLVNRIDFDIITCSCNHLTSFAIILDLNPTPVSLAHKYALNIITLVGCSLSCFGLGMVILTFLFFKQWRKSVKNKAVFNLSACLVSFLVLFITGIDQTQSKSSCLIIAVVLHYLLLTSFAWMLVSAFILYLNLVKVLGTYIPKLIQKAMIFAYGIPAVVVSTVLFYKYELYYQEHYCWLSQRAFYYAIAGPVLLMLLVNFIIFGVILHSNTCGKSKVYLRTNQGYKKLMIARAKALFCTSVLLGLSWIFGFLAVGEAKVIFQYLFAITTTLQGFLLFLFFIVRQNDVRLMWLKFLFPSSVPDKRSTSYVNSSTISHRIHTAQSDFSYSNVYNNVVFRVHSSATPYA